MTTSPTNPIDINTASETPSGAVLETALIECIKSLSLPPDHTLKLINASAKIGRVTSEGNDAKRRLSQLKTNVVAERNRLMEAQKQWRIASEEEERITNCLNKYSAISRDTQVSAQGMVANTSVSVHGADYSSDNSDASDNSESTSNDERDSIDLKYNKNIHHRLDRRRMIPQTHILKHTKVSMNKHHYSKPHTKHLEFSSIPMIPTNNLDISMILSYKDRSSNPLDRRTVNVTESITDCSDPNDSISVWKTVGNVVNSVLR